MTVYLHEGDLPDGLDLGPEVAIDSETMGLRFRRDPLCVVQLSSGNGDAHVVRLSRPDYDCPNLKALLADPKVLKLFHFGRFDIGMSLASGAGSGDPDLYFERCRGTQAIYEDLFAGVPPHQSPYDVMYDGLTALSGRRKRAVVALSLIHI